MQMDSLVRPVSDKQSSALRSEVYVQKAMPPIFGTFDFTATYVVAILWFINATTASLAGPVSFIYWIIGGLAFFLPCVLAIAQLGSMFPRDGSLYTWTYKALGPYWSFFVGVCYWIPGPLALIIASAAFVTYLQGLNNTWLVQPWQQGLAFIGLILFTGFLSARRARVVHTLINTVFWLTMLAFLLIALSAVVWLATGHASATDFRQSTGWNVNLQNIGLFGLITLSYLGTQIPLNMGGEMKAGERKPVTRHLLWGTLVVFVGYLVVTLSLLIVRGAAVQTSTDLNFELVVTVSTVLGKIPASIVALCMLIFFIAAATVYSSASSRLLLVASIDGRLPVFLGRLNKHRVPVNAILFQTVVAAIVAALAFLVFPYTFSFGKPADLANEFYNVVLAGLTLIWVLSNIFLFVDLIFLYRKDRQKFIEKRVVPLPLLWLSVIVGSITCVAVLIITLANSFIPQIDNAHWGFIVGGFLVLCLILVAIGSMVASSQASWEEMSS